MTMLLLPSFVFAADLPAECRLLPAHKPEKMSADYVPGVDVRGKPVAPADLGGSPKLDLDRVVIPLSVDLAERLQNINITGLELDAELGEVEIYQSGRVVYNGQDWTSQVYTLCGQDVPDIPIPAQKPDRQAGTDVIKSDAPQEEMIDGQLIEGGASRDDRVKK